jgi:hypothetical protein
MGLGIDLTLLAIDAEPGYLRVGPALPYALVVGELVDLAVAGRITLRGELIEVVDRSPIGDVLTDDSLARLADLGHGLTVDEWLERHGRWRVEAYLAGLREEGVLRDSSRWVVASGRIETADTLRAAVPVRRLRELIAQERDGSGALSVRDLAFVALADSTGWPQAHLRLPAHRELRARLKRLTELGAEAYEGDAAYAVLRQGMRAVAELARQTLVSGELGTEHGSGAMNRRGVRLVADVVGLLALATLVLACMTNLDLTIIIAPFILPLIGLPILWRVESRRPRRKAVNSGRLS